MDPGLPERQYLLNRILQPVPGGKPKHPLFLVKLVFRKKRF
jgi:hypothetical protein